MIFSTEKKQTMSIENYLAEVKKHFKSGIATEHTYRGDFAELIKTLAPDFEITNEPSNVTDCGNPDFVIRKKKIPIGFIEAKDVGKDLNHKQYKEQFNRYRKALDNLIITDYIYFQFFQKGEKVHEIRIAEIDGKNIKPLPKNFEQFGNLIQSFCSRITQTIGSPQILAKMMATKARLLENILEKAITSDEKNKEDSDLKRQYEALKCILIHDLTPQAFADLYAQTLAYGLFAARLHDESLDDFNREEAAKLIPKSNPFLRKLFNHLAGVDIDERIVATVDNLTDVFRATDVAELLNSFDSATQEQDPIIHFYETFLSEYDPKLRKARGVWYTPKPVVSFIVRSVDEVLKKEFNLKEGLADTSKTKVEVEVQAKAKGKDKGKALTETKEVHKVQLLDPATGTGTFLAEVVKYIHSQKFKGMQGVWSSYVEEHLIPRLNGFELLMASYAMAHLKLDMLLTETGYQSTTNQRLNICLTNSLEEYHPDTGTLFVNWLGDEANAANRIKRDTPVMCIIGNPPYSGESANKGEWIMKLMEDYKKEPGGEEKIKEKNPKWINDDYVKFLRYGQHFIEKNGIGILAFINPHGFLDNPTFRGMRWNLLKTYDKIYTIDLHGNSKKKETAPDGSVDQNVFDIQQGVSINLFIKTGKKKANTLGEVFHYDLYGKRESKYNFLDTHSLSNIEYKELPNIAPNYFFVQKDFEAQKGYDEGFKINELFTLNSVGVVTAKDSLVIDENKATLENKIKDFFELNKEVFFTKYKLTENKNWTIEIIKNKAKYFENKCLQPIYYRPFDNRFVYYNDNFIARSRNKIMKHFFNENNVGLVISRTVVGDYKWADIQVTKNITEFGVMASRVGNGAPICPLYLYSKSISKKIIGQPERIPNLNSEIVNQIAEKVNLTFTNEKETDKNTFAPIDILDYIYAVLHSPTYREKYKEFLKIDFPRVPYPKDKNTFWQLAKLGEKIRKIHLLESPTVEQFITQYPIDGDSKVEKISYNKGEVYINDTQYFDNVPQVAWEFYIGGYQPAQKWLKDRKGRILDYADISHYQKIIVALTETARLMQEIDKIKLV